MKNSHTKAGKDSLKLLNALVEASQLLNSTLNLDKILTTLLDLATKNLNADRGTIYLVDNEKGELWSKVVQGDATIEIRLPLGRGIAGTVGKDGKIINLKDAYKDKRFDRSFDAESGYRTKTMLCMPMRNKTKKIIGVFQILNKKKGFFDKHDEHFLEALSTPASLAIENARLHAAELENQKVEKELEVAARIQQQILPQSIPQADGIQIGATTIPCRAVGGDFYDVIKLSNEKLALVIADVTGKGIPAAMIVSTLQASLHAYLEFNLKSVDLVGRLNHIVHQNANLEKFITFILAIYDIPTQTVQYVNAGHNYPFIVRSYGEIQQLTKGGFCLGMLPIARYKEEEVKLFPGDIFMMYTDGVTEAMNTSQELFGEKRLYNVVKTHNTRHPSEIQIKILEELNRFSKGHETVDDITMVMLKVV